MQRTGDFQSIFNTATVKYTGPLSIVHYNGPRNKDNQMHGDGAILFANGSTYNGSFENDMLCGFGALSDPNSQSVYKGEFRDDMRHGAGVFTYPTGEYEGIFERNKRHGMGIETDAAGNRFEGLFQHGDFKRGTVVYSNGDIYQGDFLNDCKHGSGLLMRYSDGDVLRGTWINDELVDVKLR